MSNDFNSWYLALLRKQVEDEIQFLVTNSHYTNFIQTPCMFCIDSGNSWYRCPRLTALKQFQSVIAPHGSSKFHTQHERNKIGYELPKDNPTAIQSICHTDLPLLSTSI